MAEPHVLLFPFPAQGHVPTMLKLAELFLLAGFRITFVNTEHIHRRLLRNSPTLARLAGLPRFRFRTIPDGLPEDGDRRSYVHFQKLEVSIRTRSREPYRKLLAPVGQDPDEWPSVTCVVADGGLPLSWEVAEEVGIPVIFFRTSSACSFWAYYRIPDLIKGGEIPFPEEADWDEKVRGVLGMENFLRRRDLPSFCRNARTTSDRSLQSVGNATANTRRARALILNTFESLEGPVLSHIRSAIPITYALGPLHLLAKTLDNGGSDVRTHTNSVGLWQEDRTCMTWLDSQPRRSVVYVSFGSVAVMSREELVEFWHGLVDSCQRFLWVVRSDLVGGKTGEAMVAEVEGMGGRGCIVGWAPQEEVLSHPAVGCFLTHSGWNSTLESVVAGVPMVCWPCFADQQINSRFVSEVWRIGVDMKDRCERSIVEKMVRDVMEGVRAERLRTSATEMAELARRSVAHGGASYKDYWGLVEHIRAISSDVKQE